jgi:hypothetical protein
MSSDSESISDSDIEISEKTLLQDGDVSKCQDELIFDPFNPNNIQVTQKQVSVKMVMYQSVKMN